MKDFVLFIKQFYRVVWSAEKYTRSENPKYVRPKTGRIMLLSKCAVCNSSKSKFNKEQEAT